MQPDGTPTAHNYIIATPIACRSIDGSVWLRLVFLSGSCSSLGRSKLEWRSFMLDLLVVNQRERIKRCVMKELIGESKRWRANVYAVQCSWLEHQVVTSSIQLERGWMGVTGCIVARCAFSSLAVCCPPCYFLGISDWRSATPFQFVFLTFSCWSRSWLMLRLHGMKLSIPSDLL